MVPESCERQVVAEAEKIIRTRTESPTAAAARRGVSYNHMLRKIKRGEVDAVEWGSRGQMRGVDRRMMLPKASLDAI